MSSENRLTDNRLAAIRRRVNSATPGPWKCVWRGDGSGTVAPEADDYLDGVLLEDFGKAAEHVCCMRGEVHWEDGLFAAHARTDVPELLDEIERLRKIAARAMELLGELKDCGVEFADPRVRYVTVQLRRGELEAIRSFLAETAVEPK